MISSHDIHVGADAFVYERRQVLDRVEFVCEHVDPFVVGHAMALFAMRPTFERYCRTIVWSGRSDGVAAPTRLTTNVISCYERGNGSQAAWDWLSLGEALDNYVVAGIAWHEFAGLDLKAEPHLGLTWANAR